MRIIIWTDGFWPGIGGLERFCMTLVVALRDRGHECIVLTDRKTPELFGQTVYRGIPVHGFGFEKAFGMGDLKSVRRFHDECSRVIEAFHPDVIHLNTVMRGTIGYLLQENQKHRPTVLTLHDHSLPRRIKGTGRRLVQIADILVAISASVRASIESCDATRVRSLRMITNAIPPSTSPTVACPTKPSVLALGRLVQDKGFDLAIRAFARVAAEFPEAVLTIAGDGREGTSLRQLVKELNLELQIRFIGWVDPERVADLIDQHSLVMMPSRWEEPFGLVALEAAQRGRALIASKSGALPEIVVNGFSGFLVENEDVAGYSNALLRCLQEPQLVEKMGRQARLHAATHFSYDIFLSNYEKLYKEAAAVN